MPLESRTTIASAVVVSRVSYVKRVSESVSPDACAARETDKETNRVGASRIGFVDLAVPIRLRHPFT